MAKGRMAVITEVLKRWANIPTRIVCILVLLFQCAVLDTYLVVHNTLVWCLWALPDLLVVAIFIGAFVISYQYLHKKARNVHGVKHSVGGELPLGYIAWGVYAVFLCVKIAIIFGMPEYIAQKLDENSFLGVNLLKTTISLSSIIYLLLVATHNDAEGNSERQAIIKSISGGVAVDILDTVQFLDLLFIQKSRIVFTFEEHKAIIGIACINLLLPTLLLLILSRTHYGKGSYPRKLKLAHTVIYLLAINLPMLVIRLLIWHVKSSDVSVFAIKNVIGIGQTVIVIHDHMIAIDTADNVMKDIEAPAGDADAHGSREDIPMQPIRPAQSKDNVDGGDDKTTEL